MGFPGLQFFFVCYRQNRTNIQETDEKVLEKQVCITIILTCGNDKFGLFFNKLIMFLTNEFTLLTERFTSSLLQACPS